MEKQVKLFLEFLQNEKKLSDNTLQSYKRDIIQYQNYLEENGINYAKVSKEDIKAYLNYLKQIGKKPSTISRNLASIRSFYQFSIRNKKIKNDPTEDVQSPKIEKRVPSVLTAQEVELLLEQPKDVDLKGTRDKAMLEFAYATGMRVTEIINLNIEDVNLEGEYVICRVGSKQRNIPLGSLSLKALKEYIDETRPILIRNEKEKGIEFEQYEGVNSFATLLRAINKIDGIERIRFVSPHPKDFTDDVIEAIRDCEKVCKLVHLPLQSGSSEILKVMNRKYTKDQYLSLVEKMKNQIPNLTLSTDIIVGFPGETEEDFEDTLDVVSKVNFEQVYMFIYSRRVGTPGDKMENQIPEDIKHKRFDRLKQLVESQISERNKEYVGTVQKILVEGRSKTNDNMLTGRSDSNKVVILEGCDELVGKMVEIKIVSEHMWYLKGEIV